MSDFQVIGKALPLVDALQKVTGQAVYTDDLKLPGMLVGRILRSPHAHARIRGIDTSRAEAMDGVRAVVTGKEAPGRFGVLPISQDETAMATDKAIYVGDNVAGVAADTEAIALAALQAIAVDWEVLPAILQPEDALKETADPLHPEASLREDGTNVHKQVEQTFGDPPAAFAQAKAVARGEFEFTGVTHAFTEPMCTVALYEPDGRLTVWSAQQVPHYLHLAMAAVMGMPMHRIRIIRPFVGGAFGGKSDPFPHEMICALLSRKCGRPVKILFDREEVFYSNHGRHPTKTRMGMAADAEGRITALETDALIDGGAWGSFGVVTTYYNGVLSMGPYRIPSFRYRGRRVYSNKAPCGAMRGHGAVNSRFAMEVLVDELAEKLGMDPCAFRLRNALPPDTTTVNGFRITSNGTRECIEKVMEASRWKERKGLLPPGRGIGVACGFYISGSAHRIHRTELPQSTVHLKIDMDGGVTVHSMAAEIGQGSDTMLAQCVAEPLGVRLDRIRVYCRNSDTAPVDLGSYSSRVTFMAGNAAMKAGEAIRAKLCRAAAALTGRPEAGFLCRDEQVIYAPEPSVRVTYMQALEKALAQNGALLAKGVYTQPEIPVPGHKGGAAGLAPSYTFQAYVAEVAVDEETGFITVEKVWAAHDCGRALNPLAVRGQIIGCIHMGLGQALQESMDYHRGNILNPNLLDYRPISPKQMPDVEVFIVETVDPEGPFGAKEAGEGPLLPILPAVANAVHDAVGVRLRRLPMTPDRVLEAVQKKRGTSLRLPPPPKRAPEKAPR